MHSRRHCRATNPCLIPPVLSPSSPTLASPKYTELTAGHVVERYDLPDRELHPVSLRNLVPDFDLQAT